MSKTKEEILNETHNRFVDCGGNDYVPDAVALSAMESYSRQSCEPLEAKIKELEAKVNDLTMADMTHEYNQAEAERFAPEYERQIREPLEARIAALEAEVERLTKVASEAFDEGYSCGSNAINPTP